MYQIFLFNLKWLPRLIAIACLMFLASSYAQDIETNDEPDSSFSGGNGVFKTAVKLGTSYTDNFYYSNNPGQNVAGLNLGPMASYMYELNRFKFLAEGKADLAKYNAPGSEDDYLDGQLNIAMGWRPAERHQFMYEASAKFGHDAFGTERTAGTIAQNLPIDKWRTESMHIQHKYGLLADHINTELRLKANNKRYTTNESITQFLDYSSLSGGATVFYNYSPKTAFLADIGITRVSFDRSPQLSSHDRNFLLGVKWSATAKTTGDVRVGYATHTPSNSGSSNFKVFSSLDWQATLRWAPLRYRTFSLMSGRVSVPSYISNASFINSYYGNLEWAEVWTGLLTTKLSLNYAKSDFVSTPRNDANIQSAVAAEYKLMEHMLLIGSFNYSMRDSNLDFIDAKKNSVYIGIRYDR